MDRVTHLHREGLARKDGACSCGQFVRWTLGGYVVGLPPGDVFIARWKDGRIVPLYPK